MGRFREIAAAEQWCQQESGRVRHPYQGVVLVVALLMLPAVLIQDSGLRFPWGIVADSLGTAVWLIFSADRHRDDGGLRRHVSHLAGRRVVAAALMVIGIGFLGLATAAIASHFVNVDADEKHAESTDNQALILAELRRINGRLARLEQRQ